MEKTFWTLRLQRFADGGSGGGAGDGAGSAQGSGANEAGETADESSAGAKARRQGAQRTQGMKQGPRGGREAGGRQSFESLIAGEYKAEFDARVQKILKDRFKGAKGSHGAQVARPTGDMGRAPAGRGNPPAALAAEGPQAARPTGDMGRAPAGRGNPPGALNAEGPQVARPTGDMGQAPAGRDSALERWYEAGARKADMSVDRFKQLKQIEHRAEEMTRARQRAIEQVGMRREYSGLMRQADRMRRKEPGFNLDAEFAHPVTGAQFARMVLASPRGAGMPVEAAYHALHYDRIREQDAMRQWMVIRQAAQMARQYAANAIASQSMRPSENGTASRSTATVHSDPRNLTPAQREQIRNQVRTGRQVYLD